MNYAYFDTSALIKRYVEELGRREVLALLRKNHCVVSAVLPVEVRSALRRRVAEKTLDATRVAGILKRLAADRPYWTIIEVSREVLATAEFLSGAHPLRALDAIHVASANLFVDRAASQDVTFVSAGTRARSPMRWASRRATSGLSPTPCVAAAHSGARRRRTRGDCNVR